MKASEEAKEQGERGSPTGFEDIDAEHVTPRSRDDRFGAMRDDDRGARDGDNGAPSKPGGWRCELTDTEYAEMQTAIGTESDVAELESTRPCDARSDGISDGADGASDGDDSTPSKTGGWRCALSDDECTAHAPEARAEPRTDPGDKVGGIDTRDQAKAAFVSYGLRPRALFISSGAHGPRRQGGRHRHRHARPSQGGVCVVRASAARALHFEWRARARLREFNFYASPCHRPGAGRRR